VTGCRIALSIWSDRSFNTILELHIVDAIVELGPATTIDRVVAIHLSAPASTIFSSSVVVRASVGVPAAFFWRARQRDSP
jgi:hypothetical protein